MVRADSSVQPLSGWGGVQQAKNPPPKPPSRARGRSRCPASLRSKKVRPPPRSGRCRSSSVSLWPSKMRGRPVTVEPAPVPSGIRSLILRDARVYLLAPGADAALDVVDVLEARFSQELYCPRAPSVGLAVNGEGLVLIQLDQAFRQLAKRYEPRADVGDLVLVWLAHIEDGDVLSVIQPLLELSHRDLRHLVGLFLGVRLRDAAELLVVYELRNGRVLAADRAVWVLAELHLPEAHGQSVVEP